MFTSEMIAIIAGIIFFSLWFWFTLAVDQRHDLPTLQKIAKWGNVILIVVMFIIICKYDLWC